MNKDINDLEAIAEGLRKRISIRSKLLQARTPGTRCYGRTLRAKLEYERELKTIEGEIKEKKWDAQFDD